jgi:tRNA U34 2-thiouridine synthase MnmA/TrmU
MKALGLLSGGLDSTLATRLILDQGIDVVALKFTSPFCTCDQKGKCYAADVAERFGIPLIIMKKGEEYLNVIRNPKFGYGSGMNPCIDCRIFMFTRAKKVAEEIGASFVFTGEVLGERPMSQHRRALEVIERESGLEKMVLRPLSAQFLPETIPEKKGWIDRSKLLGIKGRSRKPQIELASKFSLNDYPCPAGGCLLTYREFASKVKDLFEHAEAVSMRDVVLLKIGRHFRFAQRNKMIVGRNEEENKRLLLLKYPEDYSFEVQDCGSPITILQGPKGEEAVVMAAKLTARYSDAGGGEVLVRYGNEKHIKSIIVSLPDEDEIARLRI